MRGADAQDAGELWQRSGQIQLIPGPGNVAVAKILQIIINPGGHGHPGAACGDDLVVFGGPELAHVQAVVGEAPVDRHDELGRSVPQQPPQQLGHRSALRSVAGSRSDVVQRRKPAACAHTQAPDEQQSQAAAAST